MGFKFGTFESICATAPIQVCPLLGTAQGQEPNCYARNVELAGTLIFQPAVCFVHIVAIIMTCIMILHVRSKYTAVGRKEIVTFFYMFLFIELLGLFIDSAIIPTSNSVYPWFAAIHVSVIVASFWCLLVNGFVGFQFAEDGTPMSLWFLRLTSLVVFGVSFFVSIGSVLLFAFSTSICDAVQHYIDGLFFFTLCMLLSVMMIYKYWDSITKEDLEFAVGDKGSVWEVKDPLLSHSATMDYPQDDDSYYPQAVSRGSLMNGQSGQNFYQSSGASSPRLGSQQQGGYAYPPPLKGSVSGLSSNSDGSGKGWYAGGSPRREEQVGSVGYHQSRESRGPNQGRY